MHYFDHNKQLSTTEAYRLATAEASIELAKNTRKLVRDCRKYLDQKIAGKGQLFYGINTGFGSLCDVRIFEENLGQLQENLVKSHAAGKGDPVPEVISRLILFLKIKSLSNGHSGITTETLDRLIFHFNEKITPVIYETGSLGASGDLAPLAHLSLPLTGEGEVLFKGKKEPALKILKQFDLQPIQLKAKEGLALLNGTQFMSAYGVFSLVEAQKLSRLVDFTAAMSMEGFQVKTEPFHPLIQKVRPHVGQVKTAEKILQHLENSELAELPKQQVQDPYSFRCIPQVHGAVKDVIRHVESVMTKEINAVTDNPNIFPGEDQILSGGNFHGENLAMALDYLSLALSELGSISERRTYQLLSGNRGLPHFLTSDPGLNSGLMIPQYTAAALCSQNKQLCTPASVDSIPSSNGQEDHVSMGANAAVKTYRILRNLHSILAVEFFTAAQAIDFRRPGSSSPAIEKVLKDYREKVPFITTDRVMYEVLNTTGEFLNEIKI